jgi:hypothetical protein
MQTFKRAFVLVLAAVLAMSLLASCASKDERANAPANTSAPLGESMAGNAEPTTTPTEPSKTSLVGDYYCANEARDKVVISITPSGAVYRVPIAQVLIYDYDCKWNYENGILVLKGAANSGTMDGEFQFEVQGTSLIRFHQDLEIGGTSDERIEYVKMGEKSLAEKDLGVSSVAVEVPIAYKTQTFICKGINYSGKDYRVDQLFFIGPDGKLKAYDGKSSVVVDSGVRSVFRSDGVIDPAYFYIKDNGELYAKGNNRNSTVGDGTGVDRDEFVKILDKVADVQFSDKDYGKRAFAVTTDNVMYRWGGFSEKIYAPEKCAEGVAKIVSEDMYISTDGTLYYQGDSSFSGLELSKDAYTPIMKGVKDVVGLVEGYRTIFWILIIDANDRLVAKISTANASITNSGPVNITASTPEIVLLENVDHANCILDSKGYSEQLSYWEICAVTKNGELWACGLNNNTYPIGDGTLVEKREMVKIADNISIRANMDNHSSFVAHPYALKKDGHLLSWSDKNPTPKDSGITASFISEDVKFIIDTSGKLYAISYDGAKDKCITAPIQIGGSTVTVKVPTPKVP